MLCKTKTSWIQSKTVIKGLLVYILMITDSFHQQPTQSVKTMKVCYLKICCLTKMSTYFKTKISNYKPGFHLILPHAFSRLLTFRLWWLLGTFCFFLICFKISKEVTALQINRETEIKCRHKHHTWCIPFLPFPCFAFRGFFFARTTVILCPSYSLISFRAFWASSPMEYVT